MLAWPRAGYRESPVLQAHGAERDKFCEKRVEIPAGYQSSLNGRRSVSKVHADFG